MGGGKHLSRLVPQGMVRLMHLTAELIDAQASNRSAASQRSRGATNCSTPHSVWQD